ncbi:MAG: PSD1 and planctomycete cytochrome C domain-containing protein [Verrucomicrobiales bacterium]
MFRFSPIIVILFTLHCKAYGDLKSNNRQKSEQLFSTRVKQILSSKCFPCHGENSDLKGGLDITSLDTILSGGESGRPAIVPKKPLLSPLYLSIKKEEVNNWEKMPPKKNDRLHQNEIKSIKDWIELGAYWPDKTTQEDYIKEERGGGITDEGIIVKTSGGLSEDWTYRRYKSEDIWAFEKLKDVKIPRGYNNPIDAFIGEQLKKLKLRPAEPADFRTLIKRAYFDLIGLPPTPFEIYKFRLDWENDEDKAWDNLITRLLKSPHYGEKWGQHWLDIVRYSDTGGYSNDYERSNAWRYRDYVIRSFNNDKPYNTFVMEQIAGDELWDNSPKGQKNHDQIIATGFLRMGPWDPAMIKVPEARQIYLDDVVNSVGETFLSTTMRCFKCHDHKSDPLPTRDYYQMYSAFAGTQMAERAVPFLDNENLNRFSNEKKQITKLLSFAENKVKILTTKRENAAKHWFSSRGLEYISHSKRKNLPDHKKPPRHVGLNHIEQGRLKVREQDSWIWERRLERFSPIAQSVYNGEDPSGKLMNARKLRIRKLDNQEWKPINHIYLGGSLNALGDKVEPGVLSALGVKTNSNVKEPYLIEDKLKGRRLSVARWITNPENSLTSRSIVNRIWQYHFGKAIAGNPNNFGAKGKRPTHPKLLDWLASDFVKNDWKIKRLHKLIMLSKTYRQGYFNSQKEIIKTKDPNNEYLSYFSPRRLTSEEIRDSILKMSGELNTEIGGVPVMPEINMEVALEPRMIQFSLAPAYQPSRTPKERNRRTIYTYKVRGQPNPFLEIFNQPNPNQSCEKRVTTTATPQAFTLMNSETMSDRSIAMALRVEKEAETIELKVKKAIQLIFGRVPNKNESERLKKYIREMHQYHEHNQPKKKKYPVRIIRSLVEELSGKPFEYEEILPNYANYTADQKASDVSPKTRALADMCLLLFNTNEFIYIY